jgi:hypothetical protein
MDNQNLFSQTYNQIVSNALGGDNKSFQMLSNPIDFNWPTAPTGQVSPQAYALMSCAPKYQSIGTLDFGDSNFFDNYQQVLTLLTFKVSSGQQKNLQDLQNEVIATSNAASQVITNAKSDYNTELANVGMDGMVVAYPPDGSFKSFFTGSHWNQDFANAQALAALKNKQYSDLVAQLTTDPSLQNILNLMVNPAMQIPPLPVSGPAPANGAWCKVADATGALQWKPYYGLDGSGQQMLMDLSAGTSGGFSVTLDASKSDVKMSGAFAGASFSVNAFFWGVSGSAGWSQSDVTASDSNITATISVGSSAVIPVNIGSWYNSGFMSKLAKNTDDGSSGFQLLPPWKATGAGSNVVFGQNGLLNSRVRSLVAVMNKTVTITMSSGTYNSYASQWSTAASLSIGCFSFSGYAGGSNYHVSTTGNMTTITIKDTSTDPQIIGLQLAFPGVNEAG